MIVQIYQILFIHSSVLGHLGYFHFWAMMNNATMNIYLFLCGHNVFILLGIYLGVELLGHMVTLCLTFWATARLFSTVAAPVCIPTNNGWSYFSHPRQHLLLSDFLILAILVGVKWIWLCFIDLHFPGGSWHWTSFQVLIGWLYIFSGEISTQIICPFFKWVIFLLLSC